MKRSKAHLKTDRKNAAGIRFGGVFLLILLGAFLLRIGVAVELAAINGGHNSVFSPSQQTDLATYWRLSHQILDGNFSGPFYYQPFYYAVFLPVIFFLWNSMTAVIGVQALLGTLTVGIAGMAAARLFGKRAGLFAALLTGISTPLLLYTPYLQNETLQCFNLTLLFYLTLRAMEKPTALRWIGVGIVCGVAILTRGNILLFVPLIAAGLLWSSFRAGKKWGKNLLLLALFLLSILMTELPFICYNSRVLGCFSGPSTAADAVLALGNTPEAPPGGRNPGLPAGPMEYPEAYQQWMSSSRSVPQLMWDYLCREPGAFLEQQFRKLLLFWDSAELPNNVSLYGEGKESFLLRSLLPGRSGVVISLGLAGLCLLAGRAWKRRSLRWGMLYGFISLYWGAIALFYILSRFRAPVLPLVAVAGGGFLSVALRRSRSEYRRREWGLMLITALTAGLWITFSAFDSYRENYEAAVMRLVRPHGTAIAGCTFDHGPFTCGGWNEVPLEAGTFIAKEFDRVPGKGEAEITFWCAEPGELKLRLHGKEYDFPLAVGMQKKRFPVTLLDGGLTVECLAASGKCFLIYDHQRLYGRSRLNGTLFDGEWVIRFYY